MKQVVIYTDGACRGNPGVGGWAAILRSGGHEKIVSGGEPMTTNNRMELTAAIMGLMALTKTCEVTLYTDSTYVKNGITEWLANWKQRNWKTSQKKPVKNIDLWQELDRQSSRHKVDWRWVQGHAGVEGNESADMVANAAIDEMLKSGKREPGSGKGN